MRIKIEILINIIVTKHNNQSITKQPILTILPVSIKNHGFYQNKNYQNIFK